MSYTKVAVADEKEPLTAEDDDERSGLQSTPTESKQAVEQESTERDRANSGFLSSNMFLRLTILVAVTLQNTSYALVRRYSRGHLKERYSTSSALLAMELVKLLLSMWMVVFSSEQSDVPSGSAMSKYIFLIAHSWKMLVRVRHTRCLLSTPVVAHAHAPTACALSRPTLSRAHTSARSSSDCALPS
jgi:hypothetical protein